MYCTGCKAVSPAGSRYCEACGLPLKVVCAACGEPCSPTARFCGACGTPLAVDARGGPDPAPPAFAAPAAEFKQATVLFADIVSSTELVASLDPEQAMQRLNPAVEAMVLAVKRYDGTIGRTLGDGVMAFFGAPHAHEGHALLACQAALEMLQASAQIAGIKLRIGLHSGEIVSDPATLDPSRERQMHGLAIHLASRVVAIAEPGTICLSEDSFILTRSYYDALAIGPHALKGIDTPVNIYRLLGAKPMMSSDAFRGVGLATLRGRDREMAALQRALARVEDGLTSVVGVAGAPGTGKSRLCYEFATWCRGRLVPVFEARAQLYGHATPLQPVLEFLRSVLFRIVPSDDAAMARDRIAQHIREIGPTFEADLPLMNEFLGVAEAGAPASSLSATARRRRLLDIVRHLIRHMGAKTSVILIEDLHWLDSASDDFLNTLVEAVAGTRTMLVVNYRPSYVAAWMKTPAFQEIVLDDLNVTDMDEMVRELIGARPEVIEIAHRIALRSGGNPFFAEELVRALAESGSLAGQPETTLPGTVQAVIGARIDRLSDALKGVLSICAIIGKDFPVAVLERIVELAPGGLQQSLQTLCDSEFLQMQPNTEGRWYAFRHPLIQEVAYRTQLKARRAPLHARAAQAMEAFYENRLDEYSGLLAYHYEAAGQALDAARHSARAAAWISATDTAQAIKHWRKVRELMQEQPQSASNDMLRSRASTQIAWLGWREGVTAEEAKPYIEEALALARETDDSMIPLLLFLEGRINVASGGAADYYVERVQEALQLLGPSGHPGRRATLNAALSHAYGWAGMLNEALAANSAALDEVAEIEAFDEQFLGYSVEHWVVSLRGRILARLGRDAEARHCLDTMLAVGRNPIDPTVQLIAHVGYLDIASARGDGELALSHAAQVVQIAEKHPNPYLRVFSLLCQGIAGTTLGEFAGAIEPYDKSLELLRESKAAMECEAELLANLAECRRRAGDLDGAIATAKDAIAMARARSARLPECRARITYGAALALRPQDGGVQAAQREFGLAESLIARTGAVIYAPLLKAARAG